MNSQGVTPKKRAKWGWGRFSRRSSTNMSSYLENGAFYTQSYYRTVIGNHMQSIDRQASYTPYNPLLLHKPCKRFASVARVCQRQLDFLVWLSVNGAQMQQFNRRKLFGFGISPKAHELFWNWRNFKLMLTHTDECFQSIIVINSRGKIKVLHHGKLKESVHKLGLNRFYPRDAMLARSSRQQELPPGDCDNDRQPEMAIYTFWAPVL